MISFEIVKPSTSSDPEELDIRLDLHGLESLMAQLQLLAKGKTDHVHLMSPAWGGQHLEDLSMNKDNFPVHHVKLTLSSSTS